VAANRRRAIRLCAWTALVPAVLLFALLSVAVNPIVGVVAFVVVGAVCMDGVWRIAPRLALRRIGAVPVADEDEYPRLYNVTEGLCASFGLAMPALHIVRTTSPTPARSGATPAVPTWWSRAGCSARSSSPSSRV
jgi:hypothetical protein